MSDNPIAAADRICGIADYHPLKDRLYADTYRRGAYCEWLHAHTRDGKILPMYDTIRSLATRVVELHAEQAKTKCPDDGLPPGPWRVGGEKSLYICDRIGNFVCMDAGWSNAGRWQEIAAYIARCGSPAVRRILHAVKDDAELERWANLVEKHHLLDQTDFGTKHNPIATVLAVTVTGRR